MTHLPPVAPTEAAVVVAGINPATGKPVRMAINADGTPVATAQNVTLQTALLGAAATQAIPTGAKGYFVVVLTGTATINGTALVPAGISLSDANTLAAGFSVVTAAASSAFVAWNI